MVMIDINTVIIFFFILLSSFLVLSVLLLPFEVIDSNAFIFLSSFFVFLLFSFNFFLPLINQVISDSYGGPSQQP
jgi:hypothetical protein